jgi:hypothetical protein
MVPRPARVDPAPRFVKPVVLRRPHLVLAHIRGDVGVGVLGHVPQGFHHILRLDHIVLTTVLYFRHWLAAPAVDLLTTTMPKRIGIRLDCDLP